MTRAPRLLLALALLAPAGIAPVWAETKPTLLPGAMPSLNQGRASPQRFVPAPVPNPDIIAPRVARDPNAIQVSPGLRRTDTGRALSGDGFATGSAYNGELERRGRGGVGSTLAPSLNLRMPMQVDLGSSRP
jgi:hypothetical protein